MTQQRTIELDGIKYTIVLLPARQGVAVGMELFNLAHPVLAAISDHNENEVTREILGSDSLLYSTISAHIAHNFTSTRVSNLVDMLLENLYKGIDKIDYNEEFAGRYLQLGKLVEFAIKENGFLDFFINFFKENGLETLMPLKKTTVQGQKVTSPSQSVTKSKKKPQ